jgi:site-specific recombinase XerD
MRDSGDNVFGPSLMVAEEDQSNYCRFLDDNAFQSDTRKAHINDMRKFVRWFSHANREPFSSSRVTVRDVADFRDHLRRDLQQAVATVNRCLVTIRRYFSWLVDQAILSANPAKKVKELRRQALAPKGLDRSQVRRLLREVELRQDIRAAAIFSLMLYTGCRVGDVIALELHDLVMSERSGSVTFRHGKGGKQRTVPLPILARQPLHNYLDIRPPVEASHVFIGERGPLTSRGVRNLCDKYSTICGFKFHPHLLRHSFGHQFLADTNNDLVSLAQILGHENLNTTARYTKRTHDQLGEASNRLSY